MEPNKQQPQNGNYVYSGTGYLTVLAGTAEGAVPLEGVLITVRDHEGHAVSSYLTDRSGNTPRISLPAPPRELSGEPGNPHPYAVYAAEAYKEGYYINSYGDIPVFDGITSVQSVIMIPMPENSAGTDNVIDYGNTKMDIPGGGSV